MVSDKCAAASASSLTLQQLNEDCLLHIFQPLALREQFALWRLHPNFRNIVLHLWRRKYARSIDLQDEQLRKLLQSDERRQLLRLLGSCTRAMLNLDAAACRTLAEISSEASGLAHICEITYESAAECTDGEQAVQWHAICPHLQRLQLRHASLATGALTALRNLSELQLVNCRLHAFSCDLSAIFANLRLQHFVCVCTAPSRHACHAPLPLAGIRHCRTLLTLKVGAVELYTAACEVAQLASLRKLTVLTNTTGDDARRQHCHIAAALQATKAAQIAAVRLQCHFDGQFLRRLLHLPHLRALRWHSHLQVYGGCGGISWQASDTRLPWAVLQFIAAHSCTLEELDLRWNCHVQQTFLRHLHAVLSGGGGGRESGAGCQVRWSAADASAAAAKPNSSAPLLEQLGLFEFEFEHCQAKILNF